MDLSDLFGLDLFDSDLSDWDSLGLSDSNSLCVNSPDPTDSNSTLDDQNLSLSYLTDSSDSADSNPPVASAAGLPVEAVLASTNVESNHRSRTVGKTLNPAVDTFFLHFLQV